MLFSMVSVSFGIATIVLAKPFTGIFTLSDEGRTYMFYILLVFGFTMPMDIYNGMMITGILRAGGDTRFAMFAECGSIWLIAVPLAFISALVWHLPIHLALLMTRIECLVKFIILSKRYLSGKWMNNVIHDL